MIHEGLRRLRGDGNCEWVAEYFNAVEYKSVTGFPPGPYCRKPKWDGKMVRRLYRNRLLGGAPGRGFRHTVKHHGRGSRISVPSPHGPVFIDCPHLAHVELAELDALNAALADSNSKLGRKKGFTRRGTRYPGGGAEVCWYCGRGRVWGANGTRGSLMCPGVREWRCWCPVGSKGAVTTAHAVSAVTDALFKLDGVDDQFSDLIRRAHSGGGDAERRRAKLRQDEQALAKRRANVQETMAAVGAKPLVLEGLAQVEAEEARLTGERRDVERFACRALQVPASAEELRRLFDAQCERLTAGSQEFHNLLRQLVPAVHVYLVRLLDGGRPLPRAKLTVRLDALAPDAAHVPGLPELLPQDLTVDLFDPPQREQIREAAVALAAQGLDVPAISRQMKVTQTAVRKPLALQRRMRSIGSSTSYQVLLEPPDDYPKLRRHKNRKYQFVPLDGYQRPDI